MQNEFDRKLDELLNEKDKVYLGDDFTAKVMSKVKNIKRTPPVIGFIKKATPFAAAAAIIICFSLTVQNGLFNKLAEKTSDETMMMASGEFESVPTDTDPFYDITENDDFLGYAVEEEPENIFTESESKNMIDDNAKGESAEEIEAPAMPTVVAPEAPLMPIPTVETTGQEPTVSEMPEESAPPIPEDSNEYVSDIVFPVVPTPYEPDTPVSAKTEESLPSLSSCFFATLEENKSITVYSELHLEVTSKAPIDPIIAEELTTDENGNLCEVLYSTLFPQESYLLLQSFFSASSCSKSLLTPLDSVIDTTLPGVKIILHYLITE